MDSIWIFKVLNQINRSLPSDVTVNYGTLLDFYCIFWEFSYLIDDHSCLNCCISTKLSHNVCLINLHIVVYHYAKCDRKLWNALRFYCVFWVFSYKVDERSCSISLCQMLLKAMERSSILLCFLGIFIQSWRAFMSEVLYLHQTFTDIVFD